MNNRIFLYILFVLFSTTTKGQEFTLSDFKGGQVEYVEREGIRYRLYYSTGNISVFPEYAEVVYQSGYTGEIRLKDTIQVSYFDNIWGNGIISVVWGVEKLSKDAFSGNTGITSLYVSKNIKEVNPESFLGCSNLESIIVDEDNCVFDSRDNCNAVIETSSNTLVLTCKNSTFPNSVTKIGASVYKNRTDLEDFVVNDGVRVIGQFAFDGCSNLKTVTFPESVSSIEGGAFKGCQNMKDFYCYGLPPFAVNMAIVEGSIISASPFEDIVNNTTLHVKYSYINAYKDSEKWKDFKEIVAIEGSRMSYKLTYKVDGDEYKTEEVLEGEEIVPEETPTRKGQTFSGWSEIPKTMPDHDTEIMGSFSWSKITIDDVIYEVVDTIRDYVHIIGNENASGEIIIPDSVVIDEYKWAVHEIADRAFYGCKDITKVDISAGLTSIGERAFANIDKLTDVTIRADEIPTTDRTAFENSYIEDYVTLHVPGSAIKKYKETAPWKNFKEIVVIPGTEVIEKYKLTYMVDGEEYKVVEINEGEAVTPEDVPTKEGYTFSGWTNIPETMPGEDVTVSGTFTINKYKLVYMVDGQEYKTYDVEYNSAIDAEAAPTKEGYTFSGWSEIPETMPAKDVTVSGTFTVNKYKLVYTVDGESYKEYEAEYGSTITAESEPTKEGYTFSGWGDVPETMPAKDVTLSGTFTVNKYKLIYMVDGEEYKTIEIEYGSAITPEDNPSKDGYVFSGWSEIPETMPAKDVTVTGSFSKGAYKLTYIVDGEVYKTYSYDYEDDITPEAYPEKEGYTFSGWSDIPGTMPANDVTVTGSFTINKYTITYYVDGEVYKTYEIEYGSEISQEADPEKEGYDFSGWSWTPSKMPAEDVTVTGSFTKASYDVNGAKYEINDDGMTLTKADGASGDVVLDATVTINGKTYRITVIGEGAFEGNNNITSLNVPDGINTIMPNAFNGCGNLMKLILGKDVRYIGSKAFANIGNASARRRAAAEPLVIECEAEYVPDADSDAFYGVDTKSAILKVNDELVNFYKTTSPWSSFSNIYGFSDTSSINGVFVNEEGAAIFSIDGRRLDTPQKGLNIIRTDKGVKKLYRK